MAMRHGDSFFYLKKHLISLALGLVALYAGFRLDPDILKDKAAYIIVAALFLLLAVLIPGAGIRVSGAHRWLNASLFSFQPAEIAKMALIIYLAKELSSKPLSKAALPALSATLAFVLLIIMEPDIGTAIVISMVAFVIFYLAGTPGKNFLSIIIAGIFGIIFISIKSPYRVNRLLAFRDPWEDPRGIGFHIIQSLIAVGSGGLFGLGLGGSRQKFFYLPQNYTDFIFAIYCEEMGLIGALFLIFLFIIFAARGVRIVRNAPDPFLMLLCAGIVAWISLQAVLNMSVVMGILPTTGIPLPFVSYGGTSLVTALFGAGILLNVSRYAPPRGEKA